MNRTPYRRRFLRLAALGAGITLFGTMAPHVPARAAGKVEALLLSCMDFRLMDDIERYMAQRGLRDNYDHLILGGASLGATTQKYPAWSKTFWEHLDIAIQLHGIDRVMILDHRDCGAYKVLLGEDFHKNPEKETAVHTRELKALGDAVKRKYPSMQVELLLMDLDGKVQAIA